MADPIQTASAIVTAIKKAIEVARGLKNVDIQLALLDTQERVLDLKDQVLTLRADNASLKEQLTAKVAVMFDGGAYWTEDEGAKDGPFCTRCWDADRKLVRLHPNAARGDYSYSCPECKGTFEVTSAPKMPSASPVHWA